MFTSCNNLSLGQIFVGPVFVRSNFLKLAKLVGSTNVMAYLHWQDLFVKTPAILQHDIAFLI